MPETIRTILLCEDSEFLNRVIREYLEARGHKVLAVLDAESAWSTLQQERPDVAITDYELPGMSGLDLLALITGSGFNVPVIFMTSEGTEKVAAEAVNLGATSYLIKGRREGTLQSIERSLGRVFYQIQLEETNRELLAKLKRQNDELERIVAARTRDLQKALDELQSLDKLKSDFMILMSHEMRTPVASILGFADICRQRLYESDKELGEIHQHLFQAGMRLNEFIIDALDLFEWLGGRKKLHKEPVELKDALHACLERVQPALAAKKMSVELLLTGEITVAVDLCTMQEAWIRVLDNAIKFSPEGAVISVSGRVAGGWVEIRVRDRGAGIPRDRLDRIFQPLQLAGDINHHQEGHGLSLPIVREMVLAHGGEVSVCSEGLGHGIEVTFRLPQSNASTETDRATVLVAGDTFLDAHPESSLPAE